MPALSLFDLSKQRMIQNIHMLTDIGDLPYSFLAPVLRHIQNPDQLAELEGNCPQVLGETGDIWLRFIKRDIPNWDKKPFEPRDAKNWSKAYRKLKRDAEKEEEAQKEALKQQMQALQKNRIGHQTTIVEGRTGYGPSARRKGFAFGGAGASTSWGNPAAPAKTGKAVFDKLRRGIFDQKQARPKASQMPMHMLAERRATVKQAPARLVRMQENEAPKRMVISREASASLARSNSVPSSASGPKITSRPAPQTTVATAEKPRRTHLPVGQQFSAPKLQPQRPAGAPVPKRRREAPSIFHNPKRRKV
ncbi:hypothetical protein BU26DRAFT_490975 [Trematosphaeria pertusa]|uniref:Elongin-A n=1 Tax=Trematosphaeria pertusa TaxID=390896 RepID=A0A6A6I3H9_9PLEO|nr:uncharacterized protein BU26DRAFT_490975 [Trematosphaeria pertusa]KAF2244871.1 hypothetical protein BU26DRAFT_490975 [Trematosphaeria pertusa]